MGTRVHVVGRKVCRPETRQVGLAKRGRGLCPAASILRLNGATTRKDDTSRSRFDSATGPRASMSKAIDCRRPKPVRVPSHEAWQAGAASLVPALPSGSTLSWCPVTCSSRTSRHLRAPSQEIGVVMVTSLCHPGRKMALVTGSPSFSCRQRAVSRASSVLRFCAMIRLDTSAGPAALNTLHDIVSLSSRRPERGARWRGRDIKLDFCDYLA